MGVWEDSGDMDSMWDRAVGCIKESAKEVLGVSRGWSGRYRGDWWWNEDVKKKVETKKTAYVKLVESRDEEEKRVSEAIRKMRRGRATGLDEILVDFWKFSSVAGLRWLTNLFNNIFKSVKMPEA
ncbi:uncharacterized protein LOC124898920 [Capsicum annuum]|uniref:uncharacterized protein LOC124898920 n=1 Tax=Capsicum annuum TaxID=4072 RepID=UPI001FB0AB76|nr:uncharacterized protein LOC124898920 [Capsicum annuum]